jgi:hypothetical protein
MMIPKFWWFSTSSHTAFENGGHANLRVRAAGQGIKILTGSFFRKIKNSSVETDRNIVV